MESKLAPQNESDDGRCIKQKNTAGKYMRIIYSVCLCVRVCVCVCMCVNNVLNGSSRHLTQRVERRHQQSCLKSIGHG
jgi:hypothetical protein